MMCFVNLCYHITYSWSKGLLRGQGLPGDGDLQAGHGLHA